MSSKKLPIEEKMSQSIFYNLSILKMAVKTSPDFDESLSNTVFMKSNTKAFIHVTQFLFNILDPREFRYKFHWPIVEKKAENSYRASSVDFINLLIERYSLAHEKVKLVFVVHPYGKKFMSLILSLIALATKEIMKRRRISAGKSFDIVEVSKACKNMKEIENDVTTNIKIEADAIKARTHAVQELISKIFPANEISMTFEEFIGTWHEYNVSQLLEIKIRDENMQKIYKKTAELHSRAQKLLLPPNHEITRPPLDETQEVAEFYLNTQFGSEATNIPPPFHNNSLNPSWVIAQLHLILPTIIKYASNFSLEPSDTNSEELKVLNRLSSELSKIESKTDHLSTKIKNDMTELVPKLRVAKEERQQQEEELLSPDTLAEKASKDILELEQLKLLSSPKYYIDTTKECLNHVVTKKNRFALWDDEEGEERNFNETMYISRSKFSNLNNTSRLNSTFNNITSMPPPKQRNRRRHDPMLMLENATANEPATRQDFNSTSRYTGTIPKKLTKSSIKLSSTMLSPNLHQQLFNCSTVSEIISNSPTVQSPNLSLIQESAKVEQPAINFEVIESKVSQDIKISPKRRPISPTASSKMIQKSQELVLNEETLNDDAETTVINQNSNLSSSFSFESIKIPAYENLFNISDSILKSIDD